GSVAADALTAHRRERQRKCRSEPQAGYAAFAPFEARRRCEPALPFHFSSVPVQALRQVGTLRCSSTRIVQKERRFLIAFAIYTFKLHSQSKGARGRVVQAAAAPVIVPS